MTSPSDRSDRNDAAKRAAKGSEQVTASSATSVPASLRTAQPQAWWPQAKFISAEGVREETQRTPLQGYLRALLLTLGVGLFLVLPTDILPNPIFSREVPVRWWEYLAVGATLILTFLWFALPAAPKDPQAGRFATIIGATLFAVACPVCNKIVLLLLGTSGALGLWAPAQPYIAAIAVAALALALWLRVRPRPLSL
ncbi:hypothetical protein [Boudabousia liubingyangii]|uniref:hypothetical protein n=1 Tax=Boudabousia liubingyangii TaxID=1921764 RepID=UPI000B264348|nr:hypothetical protein [Boudabousia liubingyangii]